MMVRRNADLPAALVVARPDDDGEVLVVIGGGLSHAQVRALGAMLLYRDERAQLRRFLNGQ
jgi:hypothetical protein